MSDKIKAIMLVDDDDSTNFYNKRMVKKTGLVDKIIVKNNGQDAIDYLIQADANGEVKPDLIFLDINMPGMDGWDFLEEYKKFDKTNGSTIIIIMLTTSLNPEDEARASKIDDVSGFRIKPLSEDYVVDVVKKYFAEQNN